MQAIGLDILMAAKYFERIGDHAVNIAEWVEYSITGNHRSGSSHTDNYLLRNRKSCIIVKKVLWY